MALPGAPANLGVRPGPEPQSLYVNADTVVATPSVDSYTVYVDDATGVSSSQFRVKKDLLLKPDVMVKLDFFAAVYFVTITATNSEGEGSAATEASLTLEK